MAARKDSNTDVQPHRLHYSMNTSRRARYLVIMYILAESLNFPNQVDI